MLDNVIINGQASYNEKEVIKDGVFWVVLRRKWFTLKAVALFQTGAWAGNYADALERDGYGHYTVQRVELGSPFWEPKK